MTKTRYAVKHSIFNRVTSEVAMPVTKARLSMSGTAHDTSQHCHL